MKSLEDYQKEGHNLYHKLHLSTYPVAIKYIHDVDQIPDKVMRPSALGKKLALCQAFTMARRHGSTVAMTSEDNFCVPATAVHRWVDISLDTLIESQVRQKWHKNVNAEKRKFKAFVDLVGEDYFEKEPEYMGFICSPLTDTQFIPDSVLVYCDGLQLTHLIQALSYEHQYTPNSSFEGFGESCSKGGLVPFLTQRPQIVIPGTGDRSFAGISENELAIGLPADLLFYVMNNLFKTGGRMNIGFPQRTMIATDLNEKLTPGFKYLWDKIN